MQTFIGFLRGINVGGHHKVPMAVLRELLNEIGCVHVRTLLNSGNVVFDTQKTHIQDIENKIEDFISTTFGFPIPVVVRTRKEISGLVEEDPFKNVKVHKDIRLYVSFLKDIPMVALTTPYFSADRSYEIISIRDKTVLSVLDLSATTTPKGMEDLEKLFGKNITTRNWNTIRKVVEI